MRTKMFVPMLSGVALATAVFGTAPAHADFLWAQIAGGQQSSFQISFGDHAGETSDTAVRRLVRIDSWDNKGALKPALAGNNLAAPFSAKVAGAHQTWGVVDKVAAGRGLFLLEYYAKAAPAIDGAGETAKLPIELFVKRSGAGVVAQLVRDGKPVPATEVKVGLPGSEKVTSFNTDAKGEFSFDAAKPGFYTLRAAIVDDKKGTYEGKDYNLVRNYSTLTFTVPGAAAPASGAVVTTAAAQVTPAATEAAMGNPKADPAAYALLKAASGTRQVLPADFPGFDSQIVFSNDEKSVTGTVQYRRDRDIVVEIAGLSKEDTDWVKDQVQSIIGHRRGGDFAKGDGRNPLTFGKSPDNSFGKLIELNDRMESSYRVRGTNVTEVTRVGGNVRFTISVLETQDADPGKYLPQHFIVSYRDKATNALQKVEGFRDDYTQINGYWLPVSRMVATFDNNITPSTRQIRFKGIKLATPATPAP